MRRRQLAKSLWLIPLIEAEAGGEQSPFATWERGQLLVEPFQLLALDERGASFGPRR
jgi:hypothetical protein